MFSRRRSTAGAPASGAFTLVELLVVLGLVALLIAILLPSLNKARGEANRAKCLANLRSMEIAQGIYATENHGYLIQAGFPHGGEHANAPVAWFNVLQTYGSNTLLPRCPSDTSPYWQDDAGLALAGTGDNATYRQTSYGINDFLDKDLCPWGPDFNTSAPPGGFYTKLSQVRRTSVTIQFIEMAYMGDFAASDHCHVENWAGNNIPANAAKNVQINAHDRRVPVGKYSVANYGFLDGHAESLRFDDVFRSFNQNRFDPAIAQ